MTTHASRQYSSYPRSHLGKYLVGMAVAATVMVVLPSTARAQQELTSAAQPQMKLRNAQITLRNGTSDTIQVELRVGDADNCEQNPVAAVKAIPPGRSWLIATLHPVCWRRAAGGLVGAAWTPWQQSILAAGERRVTTL